MRIHGKYKVRYVSTCSACWIEVKVVQFVVLWSNNLNGISAAPMRFRVKSAASNHPPADVAIRFREIVDVSSKLLRKPALAFPVSELGLLYTDIYYLIVGEQ